MQLPKGFIFGPRQMATRYKAVMDSIYPNKIIPKQIQQCIWYLVYCYTMMVKGRYSNNRCFCAFFNKVALYATEVLGTYQGLPCLPPADEEWSFVYRLRDAMNQWPKTKSFKIDTFANSMIWSMNQLKVKIDRFVSNNDPYKSMLLGLLSPDPREHDYAFQTLVLARRAPGGKDRIARSRNYLICKIIDLNGVWGQYPFCRIHDWPNSDGQDSMLCGRCVQYLECACLVKSKFYPFVQHYLFNEMVKNAEKEN